MFFTRAEYADALFVEFKYVSIQNIEDTDTVRTIHLWYVHGGQNNAKLHRPNGFKNHCTEEPLCSSRQRIVRNSRSKQNNHKNFLLLNRFRPLLNSYLFEIQHARPFELKKESKKYSSMGLVQVHSKTFPGHEKKALKIH